MTRDPKQPYTKEELDDERCFLLSYRYPLFAHAIGEMERYYRTAPILRPLWEWEDC